MHEGSEQQQAPIPGIRYRTEELERLVPETVNGETRMVAETYFVQVPVPPRDWDAIILRGVTLAAVAVTALSIAWTTNSIGGTLSALVPAPVAYAAASVFDTGWLVCLAIQWLSRYDPARAVKANVAGWIALVIAVAAVGADGWRAGQPIAGGVGAMVSLLAKGMWVMVLGHYSVPLGQRIGGWLAQRRQEVTAERALAGELRRLDAQRAYNRAVWGDAMVNAAAAASRSVPAPAAPPVITPAPGPAPAPVPAAESVFPLVSGQPTRTVSAQVTPPPAVPAPPVPGQPPATPATSVSGQPPATSVSGQPPVSGQAEAPMSPVRQISAPPIAATIRDVLAEAPAISDADLTVRVAAVHGDREGLAETVRRTRSREERKKKRTAS